MTSRRQFAELVEDHGRFAIVVQSCFFGNMSTETGHELFGFWSAGRVDELNKLHIGFDPLQSLNQRVYVAYNFVEEFLEI